MDNCAVVDLFCGIGGLTHGFLLENFKVIAGFDLDPTCKYAYEHNNQAKFYLEDIDSLSGDTLKSLYSKYKIKILIGCAPCQPFSTYSRKRTKPKDWDLLKAFARLVEEVQPDIVSMENVPELARNPKHSVFDEFKNKLLSNGYKIDQQIVDCRDYGVPQERNRLVLLASKLGDIALLPPTHAPSEHVTVHDAISHLPPIAAGQRSDVDPLHISSRLSELNQKRILASTPGKTWHEWTDDLVAECHKRKTGKTYVGVYGRMEWEKPAPTITTQFYGFGNGRFGHPQQHRAISLREGALLQTFPKEYQFIEASQTIFIKIVGRHIGNSVPVKLGQIIARSIRIHLENLSG